MAPLEAKSTAVSIAGSLKGGGEQKKKGRGDQSALREGLITVYDGQKEKKEDAAEKKNEREKNAKDPVAATSDKAAKTESKSQIVVDIVCVPGLGADPEKTWIQRRKVKVGDPTKSVIEERFKDGPSMIEDKNMLQKDLPKCRIMNYHYASQWWGETAVNNVIDNVANKLVSELKLKRKNCPTRPIVFIGHSLGGIVIEKTVIKAKLKGAEGLEVFNAIAGCVFLGTPFTGSPSQFKASLVAQVLEPMNLAKYNPFLKLLEEDSEVLKGLRDEFLAIVDQNSIATKNFFELQATNLNKFSNTSKWLSWTKYEELIAPRDIAVFPGKDSAGLNVDHSGLNKFDGPSNPHWISLKGAIKEVAEKAQKAIKERQNALPAKISNELFSEIQEALSTNMEFPRKDLNQIETERGDSIKEVAALTLNNEKVKSWIDDPAPGAIWLTMLPGIDKGMRAVALHQHITSTIKESESSDLAPSKLCFFFCDSTHTKKNQTLPMLKAFCYQLIAENRSLAQHLPHEKKSSQKHLEYKDVSELSDPFVAITRDETIGTIHIIVDGIDQLEEEGRKELFNVMHETLFAGPDNEYKVKAKWIFIGLDRPDIEAALKRESGLILKPDDLGTSTQWQNALKVGVRQKITELAKRMHYKKDVLFSLRTEILLRAEGNATWVDLACGEIESVSPKPINVRAFVEQLKQGLKPLYDQIRNRVLKGNDPNIEYTKEILRTMMIVVHHPTPQELALLADLPDDVWHDEKKIEEYVLRCGSFLKIKEVEDDWGNTVRKVMFMDDSAKDYLEEHAADILGLSKKLNVQHGILALRCLSYLHGVDAPDMCVEDENPFENADQKSEAGDENENEGEKNDARSETSVRATQEGEIEIKNETQETPEESQAQPKTSEEQPLSEPTVDRPDEEDIKAQEEIAKAVIKVEYPAKFWLEHAKQATDDVVEDFDLDEVFWAQKEREKLAWWPSEDDLDPKLSKLTPVHLAAYYDFCSLLDELLLNENTRQERLNAQDSFGRQPLFWAAFRGNFSAVKKLVEYGANADARSHNSLNGVCALHGAAYQGKIEMAEYLIEKGAKLDVFNKKLGTPLCYAALSNEPEMVKFLISKGASIADVPKYEMGGPLGAACWGADTIEMVQPILDAGAKLNTKYVDDDTCIHVAAWYHSPDIVAAIWNAKHDTVDDEGRQQALNEACVNGYLDIFEVIKDRLEGLDHREALTQAATQGHNEIIAAYPTQFFTQEILDECLYIATDMEKEECVDVLLERGASPNAEGDEYGCALSASGYDGTLDITKKLLDKGADPNKIHTGGYATPLISAVIGGNDELVRELIKRGADANAGPHGTYGNALYAASYMERPETVRILVEEGKADVNAEGGDYTSALMVSVQESCAEVMNYLISKGADINCRCVGAAHAMMATPLILSTLTMPIDNIKELVEAGSDINAIDDDGMTPLICAAWCPNSDAVKFLVEKGADLSIVSWTRGNALQAAAWQGDEEICQYLLELGAAVNGPPPSSFTKEGEPKIAPPIFLAARAGDLECFEVLLEHKADVHYREDEPEVGNILLAAIDGKNVEIIKIVLDRYVPINSIISEEYGSALMVSLIRANHSDDNEDYAVLKSYFERDDSEQPDINLVAGKYHTAVQAACYRSYSEIVEIILSKNPDISIRGGFYGNALNAAAAENAVWVIDSLEEKYGDLIDEDMKNVALHYAVHYKKQSAMEKMMAMGADVLSSGKWGTLTDALEKPLEEHEINSDDVPAGETDSDEEEASEEVDESVEVDEWAESVFGDDTPPKLDDGGGDTENKLETVPEVPEVVVTPVDEENISTELDKARSDDTLKLGDGDGMKEEPVSEKGEVSTFEAKQDAIAALMGKPIMSKVEGKPENDTDRTATAQNQLEAPADDPSPGAALDNAEAVGGNVAQEDGPSAEAESDTESQGEEEEDSTISDMRAILEAAILKVKEDRGIVDEPVEQLTVPSVAPSIRELPAELPSSTADEKVVVKRPDTPPSNIVELPAGPHPASPDLPAPVYSGESPRRSPPVSPPPLQIPSRENTYPGSIVPQPLFYNPGQPTPPTQSIYGEAGFGLPKQQSPPPSVLTPQPSYQGHSSDASDPRRDSLYGASPPLPAHPIQPRVLVSAPVQWIARRPVGGARVVSQAPPPASPPMPPLQQQEFHQSAPYAAPHETISYQPPPQSQAYGASDPYMSPERYNSPPPQQYQQPSGPEKSYMSPPPESYQSQQVSTGYDQSQQPYNYPPPSSSVYSSVTVPAPYSQPPQHKFCYDTAYHPPSQNSYAQPPAPEQYGGNNYQSDDRYSLPSNGRYGAPTPGSNGSYEQRQYPTPPSQPQTYEMRDPGPGPSAMPESGHGRRYSWDTPGDKEEESFAGHEQPPPPMPPRNPSDNAQLNQSRWTMNNGNGATAYMASQSQFQHHQLTPSLNANTYRLPSNSSSGQPSPSANVFDSVPQAPVEEQAKTKKKNRISSFMAPEGFMRRDSSGPSSRESGLFKKPSWLG